MTDESVEVEALVEPVFVEHGAVLLAEAVEVVEVVVVVEIVPPEVTIAGIVN